MWWTTRATRSESAGRLREGGRSYLLQFQAFCLGYPRDLVSASGEVSYIALLKHGHASHRDLWLHVASAK